MGGFSRATPQRTLIIRHEPDKEDQEDPEATLDILVSAMGRGNFASSTLQGDFKGLVSGDITLAGGPPLFAPCLHISCKVSHLHALLHRHCTKRQFFAIGVICSLLRTPDTTSPPGKVGSQLDQQSCYLRARDVMPPHLWPACAVYQMPPESKPFLI